MKRIISAISIVLIVLMVFPSVASAASFTSEADALNSLGLFKGTNNGYELDRTPSRAEAAVMLVRFLGKESEASKLTWTAPFTDVPNWAKSYVQYLYTNKLTSGTSSDKYSPDLNCSAQMYATFLLRALGYSDTKGDFSYNDAIKFAKSKGVINGTNCDENNFLRDHMVGMSYITLTLPTADGKYSNLIYKLSDNGVITKNQADAFIASHDALNKIGANVSDTYLKRFADYDAANEWTAEHITNSNCPPIEFTVAGKKSADINWEKTVSERITVVDYPDDEPVNRTYYVITYISNEYGIKVELTVTEYSNYPVVEYEAYIYNTLDSTNKNVIKDVRSINAPIIDSQSVTLHAFHGCDYTLTEYDVIDRKMSSKINKQLTYKVENGKSTSTYLPNFNIEDTVNGKGTIAVISWEGNWSSKFSVGSNGISMNAGQLETNFNLTSGESYRVPMVVLLFYKGEQANGQNIWRRWFYQHNVLREQGERMTLNFLCCVASAYPNAKDDLNAVKSIKASGLDEYIDRFTQDAGWYDCNGEGSWDDFVGNWYPDPKRYPNGLRPIVDAVHKAGMDYTLWLEPERAKPGTKTFNELKDYMLCLDTNGSLVSYTDAIYGTSCLANFSEPYVVDYFVNLLDNIIKEYDIDTYRQDSNFCQTQQYKSNLNYFMSDYWRAYDNKMSMKLGIKRTGMTENRYCTGLITFWDKLLELHPNLIIDCCASGGQRYTLKCARYSFLHTRTDWVSYTPDNNVLSPIVNAQCDSYVLNMWYQLTGSGASPTDKYDIRSRTITSYGMGVNPNSSSGYTSYIVYYKEWSASVPYIVTGDYYPLTDYSTDANDNMVFQFVNPEDDSMLVYFYFRKNSSQKVFLKEVDTSATYEYKNIDNKFKTTEISGAELAKGFTVDGKSDTCIVIKITKK